MKRLTLFLLLIITLPAMSAGEEIRWFDDFDKAIVEARAQGRPLFIDFYADWCGPCKRMDRETYTKADVISLIKAGYVAVRIDVDAHYELAKKYGGNALPAIVVIDVEDKELYRHHGFLSAQELKEILSGLTDAL